jgi:hypothetical protein
MTLFEALIARGSAEHQIEQVVADRPADVEIG